MRMVSGCIDCSIVYLEQKEYIPVHQKAFTYWNPQELVYDNTLLVDSVVFTIKMRTMNVSELYSVLLV